MDKRTDNPTPSAGSKASATVQQFFDAYRARDVETMVDLCEDTASFRYVPVEIWGRQRVIRGDGKVRTIGKVFWTGLIDSFPDLTNQVSSLSDDGSGTVAAEVTIGGTQAKDWGAFGNQGRRFELPHLFLLKVSPAGRIEHITSYFDNATMSRQLGWLEVD